MNSLGVVIAARAQRHVRGGGEHLCEVIVVAGPGPRARRPGRRARGARGALSRHGAFA